MLFSQEEKGAKASKGKSAVIINYELAKFTDVLSGLHAGISEYALIDGFYEEYELALYEYFEHRGVFLEEEEETEDYFQDEEEIDRFIGWYTYYFITDGHDKTFPALYRRLHKYELLPFEEEILKSYEDSYLNLYEVQNVEPGTGFGLKDLLGGRIHWVQDAFISRMLCKWDVIYAGLITGRGFTFLGGFEPIVIPPRLRESIQKKILEMYEDQRKEYAGLEEFLKIKSASIVALIDEILEEDFEEPPLNNDGDLLCLTTLYYRIADPDSLMEKINATSFLSGQSGPPTEKSSFLQRTYTWIRHVKKDLKVYDTPPLGVLKVEKHRFTAECNSMERAKKLRAILENTFGDLTSGDLGEHVRRSYSI